jgi:hypothetical protein
MKFEPTFSIPWMEDDRSDYFSEAASGRPENHYFRKKGELF